MAQIYVITNKVNGKQYVGKTCKGYEKRFKEHIRDSRKDRCESRPLYRAMNKYGVDNFYVELLEETPIPEEREVYWIEKLNTYRNGYNATKGGDGKPYLNSDLIIKTYNQLQNVTETAKVCHCDKFSVSNILKNNNIKVKSSIEVASEKFSKRVQQLSQDGELINIFSSIIKAGEYMDNLGFREARKCISKVANGKRKTAYGYIWKFC